MKHILIACEESQEVCTAFRQLNFEAYSCDIIPCSGGHPEWHIQGDCVPLLNGNCEFITMDNIKHNINKKWDLIIAHPPCTYLTCSGNRWFNVEKYGQKALKRINDREEAIKFFMAFVNADCDKIAIENPIGVMSTRYKKPTQIIQPYWFGDPFEKKTCLWLKNLPELKPTNMVNPPQRSAYKNGKTMPTWYSNASKKQRAKIRSKTFHGFALAMADQWSKEL